MSDENTRDTTWVRWLIGFVVVPIVVAAIGAGAFSLSHGMSTTSDISAATAGSTASPAAETTRTKPTDQVTGQTPTHSPAAATPGAADDSPMGRCQRGAAPDQQGISTFAGADSDAVYPARTAAAPDPPNAIHPGDLIKVLATGSIYFAAIGQWIDPTGNGAPAPDGWLAPHVSEYSAIARYNTNPGGWVGDPFAVGTLSTCTRYSLGYPVRLVFMTNTVRQNVGNSGAWSFAVAIYRSSTT